MFVFQNLNHAMVGMAARLLNSGVKRKTRGFNCVEYPHPVLIKIENPCDRYVNVLERKWNKILPFIESLWIALGLNDLDSLPGNYVKSLYDYSDNGRTWRAAYSPRLRYYLGHDTDYNISDRETAHVFSGSINQIDQLKFVIDSLYRDLNSRQAIISLADPSKDCFNERGQLKVTKDFPCTRSIHFQVNVNGELDCIVDMRSNDLLFGFSAINVFNFTFMQEYVANILNIPIGSYYHKADNIHYYENFQEKIEELANVDARLYITEEKWYYKDKLDSLQNFDRLIDELYAYEQELRVEKKFYDKDFGNDMFNDWGKVFLYHHAKRVVKFDNPYLVKLFGFENIDYDTYFQTYSSNKDIVGVFKGNKMTPYEIDISVKGYIKKCKEDGKKAVYLGRTNEQGKLELYYKNK